MMVNSAGIHRDHSKRVGGIPKLSNGGPIYSDHKETDGPAVSHTDHSESHLDAYDPWKGELGFQ